MPPHHGHTKPCRAHIVLLLRTTAPDTGTWYLYLLVKTVLPSTVQFLYRGFSTFVPRSNCCFYFACSCKSDWDPYCLEMTIIIWIHNCCRHPNVPSLACSSRSITSILFCLIIIIRIFPLLVVVVETNKLMRTRSACPPCPP